MHLICEKLKDGVPKCMERRSLGEIEETCGGGIKSSRIP